MTYLFDSQQKNLYDSDNEPEMEYNNTAFDTIDVHKQYRRNRTAFGASDVQYILLQEWFVCIVVSLWLLLIIIDTKFMLFQFRNQ